MKEYFNNSVFLEHVLYFDGTDASLFPRNLSEFLNLLNRITEETPFYISIFVDFRVLHMQ